MSLMQEMMKEMGGLPFEKQVPEADRRLLVELAKALDDDGKKSVIKMHVAKNPMLGVHVVDLALAAQAVGQRHRQRAAEMFLELAQTRQDHQLAVAAAVGHAVVPGGQSTGGQRRK